MIPIDVGERSLDDRHEAADGLRQEQHGKRDAGDADSRLDARAEGDGQGDVERRRRQEEPEECPDDSQIRHLP